MSPPSRRRVLRRGALVGTLGLSGCLGAVRDRSAPRRGNSRYDCENGRTMYESDVSVSGDAAWPTLQYDAGNTGYNPDATVPDAVSLRWRYTACTEVDGIVTVANGNVYPGHLVVDAGTGAREAGEWTAYQRPAVVDGTLFVGSHDLEAYDASDGGHLWTFEPAGEAGGVSAPTVHDGAVYVSGNVDDRTLYAVDATDGTERWRDEAIGGEAVSVASNAVLVGDGETLRALAREDGSERWSFRTRSVTFSDYTAAGIAVGPAVVDDVVFLATEASDVYALGPAN